MNCREPTREEAAAARRANFESIQAIIEERKQRHENNIQDAEEQEDFENGDRARLEALLIKSEQTFTLRNGRVLQGGAWTRFAWNTNSRHCNLQEATSNLRLYKVK